MSTRFKPDKLITFTINILVLLLSNTWTNYAQIQTIDTAYFEGNIRTKSSYLKHFINLGRGSTLDSTILMEDLRRLRALTSVMNVEYAVKQSGQETHLIYKITERYTLFPVGDFGITDNSFWIGGGAMQSNLLGRGLYAYGYYQYNTKSTWHLIFKNPYLFGSKWGLELQFRKMPSIEPLYEDTGELHIDFQNISLAVRYEFEPENEFWFGTSYREETYSINVINLRFQTADLRLPVQRKTQEIFFRYNRRRLNYQDLYISGWKNVMHASVLIPLRNEYNGVITLQDEFKFYKRIGNTGNLASRVMLGLSSESWTAFDPFIADSYLNLRGIGYRLYRGNILAIANLEYRQTLLNRKLSALQAVVFTDSGIIGTRDNFFSMVPDWPEKYLQTFGGIGLRFIYKKAYDAILCIDYGFNLQNLPNGGWVLGWGQYF